MHFEDLYLTHCKCEGIKPHALAQGLLGNADKALKNRTSTTMKLFDLLDRKEDFVIEMMKILSKDKRND